MYASKENLKQEPITGATNSQAYITAFLRTILFLDTF